MDDVLFNFLDPIAKVWGNHQEPYATSLNRKSLDPARKIKKKTGKGLPKV